MTTTNTAAIYPIYQLQDSNQSKELDRDSEISSYLTRAHASIVRSEKNDGRNGKTCIESSKIDGISDQLRPFVPVLDAYYGIFGRPMPRLYLQTCVEYAYKGLSIDVITDILRRTGDAPRPSWAYARAIITRCYADGVRSPTDMAQRDKVRQAANDKKTNNAFTNMDSRDISDPHYYDGIFANLSKES